MSPVSAFWSRVVVAVGLVAMTIGALDPIEGSLVVLPGTGLVALGALLEGSRHRILVYLSLVLVAVGVGALWWLSALGGLGAGTGRSNWWALVLLPYAIGWIMGLLGAIRILREGSGRSASSAGRT